VDKSISKLGKAKFRRWNRIGRGVEAKESGEKWM